MAGLIGWIKNIVVVLILNSFLELLLPSSKMKGFVKVVLGLFFIIVLIQPVLQFLQLSDYRFFLLEETNHLIPKMDQENERFERENWQLALENYGKILAQQIESLARTNPEIERAFAQVQLNKEGELTGLWLRIHLLPSEQSINIDPINISLAVKELDKKKLEIAKNLEVVLAQFYQLNGEKIKIDVLD